MKLSIIIPTKDRHEVFDLTIANAIKAIEGVDAEIIVVNDSKTASVQLPVASSKVNLLNNPKSGVAAARNFGAANANGEVLLFVDDDILIGKDNIKAILEAHQQFPDAALNLLWVYPPALLNQVRETSFGRFLIRYGFTSMKEGLGSEWRDSDFIETSVAASFFLCLSRTVFQRVGGYNEQFPHAGSEDHDFSMRLKELGIKRLVFTRSIVFHNEMDRIQLIKWLHREEKGAETRAWGYSLGRSELGLDTSLLKSISYSFFAQIKQLLIAIQANFPDKPATDQLNHRLIHILLGTSIYQGYKKGLKDAGKQAQ